MSNNNGKIEAKKIVFQDIFSEKFWFVVPEFQRSYVWGKDNISELLDDLFYAFEAKPESDYFLGTIVLKKTDEKNYDLYELLDGQQRLTTFLLMMAVLRDISNSDNYKKAIHETIFQEENKLRKIPSKIRITYKIRDNVDKFFEKIILEKNGTKNSKCIEAFKNNSNISIENMIKAIEFMSDCLTKKDNLEDFTTFIFNNCLFIYVATDTTEDAFRLFTILNNRGIPLTASDILKSENIGELIDENEKLKYANRWEKIESERKLNFDRFLQFVRTILIKEKAHSSLTEEFNEKIYNANPPLLKRGKETLDYVFKIDEIYYQILEFENKNLTNEFKNLVTIMKLGLRSEEWIPSLISYYNKFGEYKLTEFLKLLEFKFLGDWVCGLSPTKRIESMNNILKEISLKSADELFSNMDIFYIDLIEFENFLNANIYDKSYLKYLLLKWEYLKGDNSVHISSYEYISVEHVLPQNPKQDSQWKKDFTEEQIIFWTHKIANLVLISRRKNSTLSNHDFTIKKEKYLKNNLDIFQANKIFIDMNNEWTPKILESRQKEIVKKLIQNM